MYGNDRFFLKTVAVPSQFEENVPNFVVITLPADGLGTTPVGQIITASVPSILVSWVLKV